MNSTGLEYVDEDYENRMISFEIDCQGGKGSALACHHVGDYIAIIKDDKPRALKMYELNCEDNKHLPSCFSAARIHTAGRHVPKDLKRGETLFGRACTGGVLPACYFYGAMLVANKEGTPETKQKGLDVLLDSCRKGETESCNSIGNWYLDPKNPTRNPLLAEEVLKIACSHYYAPACYNLAVMYSKGDVGITPNPVLHEEYKKKTRSIWGERDELQKQLGGPGGPPGSSSGSGSVSATK